MFKNWSSGDLLCWYLKSVHKKRIDHAGTCLLRRKYLPVVVRQYLHEWVRFVHYLAERAIPLPTSFHEAEVQRYFAARFPKGSASRRRGIRAAIRIFLGIDDDGQFPRRVLAPPRPTNALFEQAVPAYLDFLRKHRGLSARTLSKRTFQLILFTEYLERIGVSTWKDVQPSSLRTFLVAQLTGIKPATRLGYASTLRSFHRWAFSHGLLERDYSAAAAAVRQYRLAGIPDLLTDNEVAALLQAVDRSTALGKRDYAILLLAARYGMRPSDLGQLSLDHIDWRGRQIALPQVKTGRLLALPLLPEVQDALIVYLREGRPQTEFRNVFVRHLAPYEPFAPKNNLPTIFREALRRAGLAERPGRKGFYLLRHTLASRLLRAGSSIKTIADVLGHVHLNSTLVYAKVDLTNLETVTLSIEELLPAGAVLEHNARAPTHSGPPVLQLSCRRGRTYGSSTEELPGASSPPLRPAHSDSRRGQAFPGDVLDLSPCPLFSTTRRGARYCSDPSLFGRPAAWRSTASHHRGCRSVAWLAAGAFDEVR